MTRRRAPGDHARPVCSTIKCVVAVERLPKTRSGKSLRLTIKWIADGEAYPPPATIEDPPVLAEIEDALASNRRWASYRKSVLSAKTEMSWFGEGTSTFYHEMHFETDKIKCRLSVRNCRR
jgi:hypothetical protein